MDEVWTETMVQTDLMTSDPQAHITQCSTQCSAQCIAIYIYLFSRTSGLVVAAGNTVIYVCCVKLIIMQLYYFLPMGRFA